MEASAIFFQVWSIFGDSHLKSDFDFSKIIETYSTMLMNHLVQKTPYNFRMEFSISDQCDSLLKLPAGLHTARML